jgi:hypothetical protein|mmetsp:Transcript_7054/g.10736  ORF Transcript_7054/g.10736 Transcript_7054/m.10736 type:complete len:100 (-) Transcript_7054:527-826(-)
MAWRFFNLLVSVTGSLNDTGRAIKHTIGACVDEQMSQEGIMLKCPNAAKVSTCVCVWASTHVCGIKTQQPKHATHKTAHIGGWGAIGCFAKSANNNKQE